MRCRGLADTAMLTTARNTKTVEGKNNECELERINSLRSCCYNLEDSDIIVLLTKLPVQELILLLLHC